MGVLGLSRPPRNTDKYHREMCWTARGLQELEVEEKIKKDNKLIFD